MSNSHLFMPSGFPRAPLQNGIGRYICQLQRVTIKFCKNNGASRGVRKFLENSLLDYAKNHPGVVVYVKPRRHRSPALSAEYLNGERQYVNCHNFTEDEVTKWMELLRTQQGGFTMRYRKTWHTDSPSIQGVWTPMTNRPPRLNVAKFPDEELSTPVNLKPTATQQIIEIYKEQQNKKEIPESEEDERLKK
ncbi:39S ribosomal protein L43, mitochondrial [Ischnura elegans]|uniref:39S ribosomal protein L43, mitochondrial n=1 Tax=Ischnura elegans TaxID=197161 RepID=UPI001ED8A908|nr:39S ribosomal protein L43, mitochondrial [Ischnura elegans]